MNVDVPNPYQPSQTVDVDSSSSTIQSNSMPYWGVFLGAAVGGITIAVVTEALLLRLNLAESTLPVAGIAGLISGGLASIGTWALCSRNWLNSLNLSIGDMALLVVATGISMPINIAISAFALSCCGSYLPSISEVIDLLLCFGIPGMVFCFIELFVLQLTIALTRGRKSDAQR